MCVCEWERETHAVVSHPLQGVTQVEIKAPVVRPGFTWLQTLLRERERCFWKVHCYSSCIYACVCVCAYPQVWYALCYLVLWLEDEAVVNFSEAVARGNSQNLEGAGQKRMTAEHHWTERMSLKLEVPPPFKKTLLATKEKYQKNKTLNPRSLRAGFIL